MIRKYKEKDLDIIMKIWQEENINAHNFISKEYWKNNYEYVKSILPKAEILVYSIDENIVGFIGLNGNYIEGIFINKDFQGQRYRNRVIKISNERKRRVKFKSI